MTITKAEAKQLATEYKKLPKYPPLILPIPTSKNKLRNHGRRSGYHTPQYKKFRKETAIAFQQWKPKNFNPFKGGRSRLILTFDYQLFTQTHRGDLMNHSQALLDALNGLAWEDDAYINLDLLIPNHPSEMINKENPHCKIWLNPTHLCCV